ncbi:MAG: amino acid--tRNA ligase-related protein, partial [Clostridia bacterium]
GGASQGRKFFDSMTEFAVEEQGAKGLAWTKIDENNTPQGGIAKFITEDILKGLEQDFGVKQGDSIFFIADKLEIAQKIAGQVRIELGNRLDLLEKNVYRFCFIVDFPMYEYNEDEDRIDFNHNPFSMPQGGMEALENKNPLDIVAYQYDLVCNGYEMASGAVRNHDPKLMVKAFEIAGYSEKTVEEKFGALYKAFKYGTPPHAGAAPGLDRMVMLIANTQNIREVIAFPKNKKARDVMMNAPSRVEEKQLKDVHIKIEE